MAADDKPDNKHWSNLYLTVTEGPVKGARYSLNDGENILGRAGTVRLEAEGVSRQHASITVGEELQLEDLGSTSGTMLNSRMLVGKDFIFDGDEIRLGTVALRLSAKRRENRASVIGATVAIVVGLLLLFIGLFLQDYLSTLWQQRAVQRQRQEQMVVLPSWRDWNNLEFPSRAAFEEEGLAITPSSALSEFNFGVQMYQDRMLDPGNAYLGIVHFKRALGMVELLPPEERPAIANRAITHLSDLQRTINANCDTKVFAYVRARQMQYWDGCYEALNMILRYVPVPTDPYHAWAREQVARLDLRFKR